MSDTTANRGYPLPNPSNTLDVDVVALITLARKIDVDVAAILADLATRPTTATVATAIAQAIAGKANSNDVTGWLADKANASELTAVNSALTSAINTKQAALVSGTSLKTINGISLLGAGNLVVSPVQTALTPANNAQDLPEGECSLLASAPFTMYLPAAPAIGWACLLTNPNWSWGSGNFVLARRNATHYVNGQQQDTRFSANVPCVLIRYGAADGWVMK